MFGSRRGSQKIVLNGSYSETPTAKKLNWKDQFMAFKKEKLLSSPHLNNSESSHYFSENLNVSSTPNSIIVQTGGVRTFIS